MKMKLLLPAFVALATGLLTGCGARHSDKEVYYLVASNMSSAYWQSAVTGFKKAAAQYGVTAENRRARHLRSAG